ncbi:MAG: cupin domain-containing protein [Alphaproteobacteria bacterium]
MRAEDVVRLLNLAPHPEGGHFRETYRHVPQAGGRGAMTAIYYLLAAGERSQWHRVDADELWHHYAGAPLALALSADGTDREDLVLGAAFAEGARPQILVPSGTWQAARSLGAWTLVGCTVGPAFEFGGFELAPTGWEPGPG